MKIPRILLLTTGLALAWLVLGVTAGRNSDATTGRIAGRPAVEGNITTAGPGIEAFGVTLQGPDRRSDLRPTTAPATSETKRTADSSPDDSPGWVVGAAGFCARVAMVLLKMILKLLIGWLPIEGF